MALTSIFGLACERPAHGAAADLPKPAADLPAPKDNAEQTAVFAGGCFWCTEAVFEKLAGVKDVVSGYAGGTKESAEYEVVSSGRTGHAEAVKITYDPSKITYGELLRVFFTTHNPTTKDAQGPDHGHQYRSAVFYENEDQRKVADAYIKQLTEAKAFDKPIATTLEPLKAFYPAENYHQDFVKKHPDHGYVVQFALPKVQKVMEHFKESVKKDEEKK